MGGDEVKEEDETTANEEGSELRFEAEDGDENEINEEVNELMEEMEKIEE